MVDEKTLVVYFFSNDGYVRQYETDLLQGMKTGNKALFQLGISEQQLDDPGLQAQVTLSSNGATVLARDFLPVCSILPGTAAWFFQKHKPRIIPDTPSVSGAISRVVEGVNIYPVIL